MTDLGAVHGLGVGSIAELLSLPLAQVEDLLEQAVETIALDAADIALQAPIDGLTEVWAAGVTYRRSQEARIEESEVQDVYARVYDADRPELFFKSVAWRVVGDGQPIGIREDSATNVPEPELALVLNRHGEVIGLTVCDDMSSRSIEGANPLYLPQAKIYAGSCALGPGIRPARDVRLADGLDIAVEVTREAATIWSGSTRTSLMRRSYDELIDYLFRANDFPFGVVLATGTGLVPALDICVEEGDTVTVTIDGVGVLTNHVVRGAAAFSWLADACRTVQ
ncbi:fumarylacetoacetate hydrolase family protein [Nonomuraea lactucae]|uniref:fumarylacetoacetate hydrolase family protein n=1 Tax=Nonomuraea lactucae TaxID=2249762 RepID=UPI00196563DF|nr:fumarylacetoacetate hydrolase family protein [Nonomuraea lactucae]